MLKESFQLLKTELCQFCKDVYGEGLVTLAVFGSVGRGTPSTVSDIDFLIIANQLPTGRIKRIEQFSAVEEKMGPMLDSLREKGVHTSLSPVIKTPEEVLAGSLLFLDMINDAVLLYDKDGFFDKYLKAFTARLKKLGAKKIYLRGRWHWLLKPDYQQGEVFEI